MPGLFAHALSVLDSMPQDLYVDAEGAQLIVSNIETKGQAQGIMSVIAYGFALSLDAAKVKGQEKRATAFTHSAANGENDEHAWYDQEEERVIFNFPFAPDVNGMKQALNGLSRYLCSYRVDYIQPMKVKDEAAVMAGQQVYLLDFNKSFVGDRALRHSIYDFAFTGVIDGLLAYNQSAAKKNEDYMGLTRPGGSDAGYVYMIKRELHENLMDNEFPKRSLTQDGNEASR